MLGLCMNELQTAQLRHWQWHGYEEAIEVLRLGMVTSQHQELPDQPRQPGVIRKSASPRSVY